MRAILILLIIALSGCTQVRQSAEASLQRGLTAIERNEMTRMEWRAQCRLQVEKIVAAYDLEAGKAIGDGDWARAQVAFANIGVMYDANWPILVLDRTVRGIKAKVEEAEDEDPFPLQCDLNPDGLKALPEPNPTS